ncbi:ATP-grasp domain-containing protein [Brevibacillus ruminantium]|uniref:ATP-grasp domain-containing protein n=1 Tax=Brevibacillus ruminantium TaxID=2950604 RepID=A0ABY4WCX4_9BACL|nr:ATP-grasp domain-containing protein [Brevibacillus ruminantium]USG64604.1 ATP-grasp domain-containing protein [Brevibacillus ruminantium]
MRQKKKVLLLRGLDISVVNPHLTHINQYAKENADDIELSLAYTEGLPEENPEVLDAEKYFNGNVYYFPTDVSHMELAQFVIENGFDVVVSISMPDKNNVRDSRLKEHLEKNHGIKVVAHSLEVCELMCDKYRTELHLKKHHFHPIPSHFVYNLEEAREVAQAIGYPIIIKPSELCLSEGVEYIQSDEQLHDYFEKFGFPKMMQKFLQGTQISVEVIGQKGNYIDMVPISKEETGFSEHCPLEKFRVGPIKNTIGSNEELGRISREIAESLNMEGAIEIEYIIADGQIYVLEINPRTSGCVNLSIASTELNTYTLLIDMGLDRFDLHQVEKKKNYVCEFPVKKELSYEDLTYLLKLPGVIHFERNKAEWFEHEENFNLTNFGRFYITGKTPADIRGILDDFRRVTGDLGFEEKIDVYLAKDEEVLV